MRIFHENGSKTGWTAYPYLEQGQGRLKLREKRFQNYRKKENIIRGKGRLKLQENGDKENAY